MVVALASLLSACGSVEHKPRGYAAQASVAPLTNPRKLVIFFDGTANDEGSDTNTKRLHSLITLQNRPDIASLYVQGVGTNSDGLGMVTGAGISARVRLGYEFILNHYRPANEDIEQPEDEVYIFGFSRGAYAARILASMLDVAGAVEESKLPRKLTGQELAELVFDETFPPAFHDLKDLGKDRREKLQSRLKDRGLQEKNSLGGALRPVRSVPVKVLGLWDTVEQLGIPNLFERVAIGLNSLPPDANVDVPNKRYGERLCNVERAYHAMSIDDDRETVFTPLPLSRTHFFEDCSRDSTPMLKKGVKDRLQEVWFSGAHSDVGGGYLNSALNGVSLNWMLARLEEDTDLLPKRDRQSPAPDGKHLAPDGKPWRETAFRHLREDIFGSSHDPASGVWAIPYPRVNRDLVAYALSERAHPEFRGSICVHESVFARRNFMGQKDHEYSQLKLIEPGLVELVAGPDSKGPNWTRLVERTGRDQAERERIFVQQYPDCQFMSHFKLSNVFKPSHVVQTP